MKRILGSGVLAVSGIAAVLAAAPASAATAAPQVRTAVPGVSAASGPAVQHQTDGAQRTGKTCRTFSNGTGDLCLFYLPGYRGSRIGIYANDASLWDNHFRTVGRGRGRIVANNAESVYNNDTIYTANLCTDVNYGGVCGALWPRSGGTLTSTYYDNVESLYFTN